MIRPIIILSIIFLGFTITCTCAFAQSAYNQQLFSVSNTGGITVIDTVTGITNNISVNAQGIQFVTSNPAGTRLYLSDYYGGALIVVNPITYAEIGRINITTPAGMSISPDGKTGYIADYADNKIYKLDITNPVPIITSVISSSGTGPFNVAITPDGTTFYCADFNNKSIDVVNTNTFTITSVLTPSNANTSSMIVTPDGTTLIVANDNQNLGVNGTLDFFSTSTNSLIHTINTWKFPSGLSIDFTTNDVYVAVIATPGSTSAILEYNIATYNLDSQFSYSSTSASAIARSNSNQIFAGYGNKITAFNVNNGNAQVYTITINNGLIQRMTLITPASELTTASQLHLVTFTVQTFFGAILWSNITTNVYYSSNGTLAFSSQTDLGGSASFLLDGSKMYHVTFINQSQGISQTMDLFPTDSTYTINVIPNPFNSFTQFFQTNTSQSIITTVTSGIDGGNTGTINGTYVDTSGTSSLFNFSLYQQDTLNGGPPTLVATSGGVVLPDGIVFNALNFDGSSTFVNIDSSGGVYGTTGYGVSAIVQTTNTSGLQRVYSEGNSASTSQLFAIALNNGFVMVQIRNNTPANLVSFTSSAFVADGTPHRISWTDNNGAWNLYVDGLLINSGTYTPSTTTLNKATIGALGRTTYSNFFNGIISDVRLWTVVRTQNQIQTTMFERLSGSEPGLKAYYKLDTGSGTVATDSTANHFNGTITNPRWTTMQWPSLATWTFTIPNAPGTTWQVFINATSGTFGSTSRNYGVSFPGPTVSLGFIDQSWYNWITLFILIIVLAVFTRITMGIGIIITAACAALATVMGWFAPFNNIALNYAAIALIFLIGVAIYINDKETGA